MCFKSVLHYMVYINFSYIIIKLLFKYEKQIKDHRIACEINTNLSVYFRKEDCIMAQEILRKRLINIIIVEGVNQKHIAKQTKIPESLLSRFKNSKCDLGLFDREALDSFLKLKGF